jgi:hypothetical protein
MCGVYTFRIVVTEEIKEIIQDTSAAQTKSNVRDINARII